MRKGWANSRRPRRGPNLYRDSSLTLLAADGSIWCIVVSKRARTARRRFTVTLDADMYDRLKTLVESHEPPLTFSYGVRYAVNLLLETADDPQAVFSFADPTRRKRQE